jgi:hypothetical protein
MIKATMKNKSKSRELHLDQGHEKIHWRDMKNTGTVINRPRPGKNGGCGRR